MSVRTVHDVLQEQAQLRPDASAILSLEHSPLSYGRLYEHIQYTIQALHSFGVGRFQRVGLIAPPGPELATAMLSIASCATVVPLNPNLQAAEYQSYFPLLKLDWIMVPAGTAAEARNAARASAIPVIDMYPAGTEAGARLIFRVREALGIMVTIVDLFDASTIAEQAQVLEQLRLTGDT